jgi:hypothetical protein
MSGVTSTGFQRDRLDVILDKLQTRLKDPSCLGSEAVLDATTPDGQEVGIIAELVDDLLQTAEDAYNVADPNNARGAALYRLGLLCGIRRDPGSYGKVTCTMHVAEGETIPAGFQFKDTTTGIVYATLTDVGPSTGAGTDYTVQAEATTYGAAARTTHTAEKVVDVFGFIDITFASDGTAGLAEESEGKFRQRRNRSVAKPSQSMVDSLYAALADLSGIGDVRVYNNPTAAYADIKPGDSAIPGHSCIVVVRNAVVVEGVDQVARTIWLYQNPGCDFVGTERVELTDSRGGAHRVGYYVSAPYEVDVEVTYKALPGEGFDDTPGSEDEATVQEALSTWASETQLPGDDLKWGRLPAVILGAVVNASGGFTIDLETVRVRPHATGAFAAVDLSVPFNQHAAISIANVTMIAQ